MSYIYLGLPNKKALHRQDSLWSHYLCISFWYDFLWSVIQEVVASDIGTTTYILVSDSAELTWPFKDKKLLGNTDNLKNMEHVVSVIFLIILFLLHWAIWTL